MPQRTFSNETKLLLYCARTEINTLLKRQIQELLNSPVDWTQIINRSFYHDVAPLIYYNLNKFEKQYIAKPALAILKNFYYATLARNICLWREFCLIQEALHKVGIEIIPLKGIVLADILYHNIGVRPMLDIDILTKEKDLESTEKCILKFGYQKQLNKFSENYERMHHAHTCFFNFKNKILLELHWKMAPSRPNTLNINDIWSRAKVRVIDQAQVLSLSLEDTLLCLCLHIGKNVSCLQQIKLKNLCDIHELITQHGSNMDWNYIADKLESWRIKVLLFYIHRMTETYLNTLWPAKITKQLNPNIIQKKIITGYILKLEYLTRIHAVLLMALMLDKLRDLFSLIFMGALMIYKKNKFLIFRSKIR